MFHLSPLSPLRALKRPLLLLLTASFALGCSQMSSSEVATQDIEADITVTAYGDGTAQVEALLHHARSVWRDGVRLDAGDALVVEYGGRARTLADGGAFSPRYAATLPTDAPELPVRVALDRPRFTPAPNSQVRLPAPFRIYPSRGVWDVDFDTIPIEWSNASRDALVIGIDGDCVWPADYHVPYDDGVFLLRPGALDLHPSWDGRLCQLEITLTRSRAGRLDPALARSGQISAHQVRRTQVLIEGW